MGRERIGDNLKRLFIIPILLWATFAHAGYTVSSGNLLVPAGNIGIGSTTPRGKLDVSGNIYGTAYYGNGANLTNLPASMTYPASGIAVSTGSAWTTSIADASTNWNTAYSDRLKWDGGSTGLVAATGRTSLELGTAAQSASTDFLAAGATAVNSSAVEGTDLGTLTNGKVCTYDSAGTEIDCDTTMTVDTNTTYTATANRGLLLTSSTQFGLIETCNANEILKWSGSAWACSADNSSAGSGTPGGSTTQLQYNNSGVFGGIDGTVYSGTNLSFTGNIGIGSTLPEQKLKVVGNILATGTVTGSNLSGTNTGDNATNTQYSGLVTNATHTGEVTGATALTIADGVTVANWTLTSPNIGVSTATSVNKVTITAPATSATLTIADGKTLTATNTVNLNTMTDGKFCTYSTSGTALNCASDAGGALSGLTAGKLPKASSASTIVDSQIYDNGTNVGIGTTAPSQKLQVDGAIYANSTGDTLLNFTGGNVGINSTSPTSRLSIDGTIYSKGLTIGGSHGSAYYLCLGIDGVIYGQAGLCR